MADGIPRRHHFDRHAHIIIKSLTGGDPDDAFSSEDVALILRVSQQWLDLACMKNYGPPFERRGTQRCYRRGKLIEYLRQRQRAFDREIPTPSPPVTWPAKKRQAVAG